MFLWLTPLCISYTINICEFIIVLYFKCSNIFKSILMMTFSSCTDTNWQINWKSVLRKHFGFSVFQLFTCHHNCFGKFSLLIFRVMYTLLVFVIVILLNFGTYINTTLNELNKSGWQMLHSFSHSVFFAKCKYFFILCNYMKMKSA